MIMQPTEIDNKFKQLETELAPYKGLMSKASDAILRQEVSKYPIFVIHQQIIDMGLPLVDKNASLGKWSVNASTLEEFVTKRLIDTDKLEDFKQVYKNPENHLCLFILSDLGVTFVFTPRSQNE